MNFFKIFFGDKTSKKKGIESKEQGKYMPEVKIPIDESFTLNFKANGGKFLYCENIDEVYSNLNAILEENDWLDKKGFFYDLNLKNHFKKTNIIPSNLSESDFFITTCENLIANDGSILVSSNQIAEKKLSELPDNVIVYATTSQIIGNIGDGLREIKNKNKKRIPTNITTIKHFKLVDEKDFLSYGSSSKNLYLLLLEDL